MSASIRGHQGQFKLFTDGQLDKIVDITKVAVAQDSSFMRTNYVGRPIPEGDQTTDGWSGSIDLEVKDSSVDDLIDALIQNQLNGIGVSDYSFVSSESYANGTVKSWVYVDVQWKMSKNQGGQNEKMTKKLDFQAAHRIAL